MSYPITRMRRLRRTETLRRMVRETRLCRDDLILPLFAVEGSGVREPITSMPGVFRYSVDTLSRLLETPPSPMPSFPLDPAQRRELAVYMLDSRR